MKHIPVLKEHVQKYLELESGEVVVDATLGLGGHSKDILEAIGETGKLIAFEQDERNLAEARENLSAYQKQILFIHDNFRYLKKRITGHGVHKIDAILYDLGLSSPHVDEPERGFSFLKEGPLDMRYDPQNALTAGEVVNSYPEEELTKIFFKYGEEKLSKKIARKICERRKQQKFETTTDLAEFIEQIVPKKRSSKGGKSHPATRIFQALRIEVNDEMEVLNKSLEQAVEMLNVGGRIVVISYHSLEDKLVKHFFKDLERPEPTPEQAIYQNFGDPIFKKLTKKPVVPTEEEIEENIRSRSAKLRAYEKVREIN